MTSTNDITEIFQERIGNRSMGSLEELNHLLAEFSQIPCTHYSVRTSNRDRSGDVTSIKYICQRKGFALKPSRGLRHQTPTTTQCEAYFNVGRIGASFRISSSNMIHNHELQIGEAGSWHFRNRRLTPTQLDILRPILECGDSAFNIRYYVKSRFQKNLTGCDVNMRRRVLVGRNNPTYIRRMESELNVNGKARALLDETNKMTHFIFSSQEILSLFNCFPDFILIDGTFPTNREKHFLYQLMIVDGCRKSLPVALGSMWRGTADDIRTFLSTFVEFVGGLEAVVAIMSDGAPAIANAVEDVFPRASHLLCRVHMIRNVTR